MLEKACIKNTLLLDGEDIVFILNEIIILPNALDKEIHSAQMHGQFFINSLIGKSKIKA